MYKVLIKNGRVWDGQRFLAADILTDGENIAKLEPNITDHAHFVYDAKGKIVSTGLVDTHIHMRVTGQERYGIQPEMACFPFGVTAAADAGRWHGDLGVMNAFMLKNVVFVSAPLQQERPDFSKTAEKLAYYGDKAVGLKVFFDTTTTQVSSIKPLRYVCDFAREKGLRVMVHCAHSPVPMGQILDTLAAGDILTHAFHGAENNASEDCFESMKQAQARGVVIDTGFAGNVHTDFAVLKQAIQNGVFPNTISTDITKYSAYFRGGRYGMTMCMNIAKAVGMSEEDIFRAVTSSPAKALGKEQEWGYLKVGRSADIAVFDYTDEGFDLTDKAGNRIQSDIGYRCVLTVCDGQVIYKY